jgi:tetratricopeptide (TPR) repeat protein
VELARALAAHGQLLMLLAHQADARARCEEAVAVARQFGALAYYGPNLLADAANALLSLGRREEAERVLDQVFDLDLRSAGSRSRPLTVRGTLRLRTGDLAGAQADLRQVLEEAPAPLDPQNATPVLIGLAQAALWDGRLDDARAAVADGLEVLATAEEPFWIGELCRTGLAVGAALAEQARARRADAEAEWSRAAGPNDPDRWAASAQAWRRSATRGMPATPAGGRPGRCWPGGRPGPPPPPWPGRAPWPAGSGRGR